MKLKAALNRIKQYIFWLIRGKIHILTIVTVGVTIFYIVGWLHFYPNIVALVLTITGLLIIWKQQVLDAQKFAENRPNTFHNWIKSRPTGKPITLSIDLASSLSMAGKVRGTVSIPIDSPIEKKVAFLLQQLKNVQAEIGKIDGRIEDVEATLIEKSKELTDELDNINSSLKALIAGHIVGDYDINLFGIVITICGTLIQFFRP